MQTQSAEFRQMKKIKLTLNMISEILLIIGGILALRPAQSMTVPIIGLSIFILGIIVGIVAYILRSRKKYRKLEEEEENIESFKELKDEFGVGMIVMALIFLIALFIGGMFFLFFISNSWIKAIFFFLAYELVTDFRDFMKLDQVQENDN